MSIYQELDIRPVINASATLTRLGGSLMPPPVTQAMSEAAGNFVDLVEFQEKAGRRIADLTHNEAAFISSGAAGGIAMTVAACIAGSDAELQQSFPYLEGIEKKEVIVYRGQRNGYDYAARQTGAKLIEIDPDSDDLETSIGPRTACVLFFAGAHYVDAALPLEEVIAISHTLGAPVIVDAAAQVPPVSSLWYFTQELGADAAIFSGGKGLRGPQSSGVVLGKQWVIDGCRSNAAPFHSLGRPMKVGKEETAGLLAAIEWSLAQDEPATLQRYENVVQYWLDGLSGLSGVAVERSYPSEAGQPHGRALIHIGSEAGVSRDDVVSALWNRDPRIAVAEIDDDALALNPQTVEDGEEKIVLDALRGILAA